MSFENRQQAGEQLGQKLKAYQNQNVAVYALPRGGVVTGLAVAKLLQAPLDLIITRKIGHPFQPEYAIAAISENGKIIANQQELAKVDQQWFTEEKERQQTEAKRRRATYLKNRSAITCKGKIAILVDDGVATGLTIKAAVSELKNYQPSKIIVAVPVIPQSTFNDLKKDVDEVVAIKVPPDQLFLGSVGNYYDNFAEVKDDEVIEILGSYQVSDPLIFAFPQYQSMAAQLVKQPVFSLGKWTKKRFANQELQIELQTDVCANDCVILGSISPPEENIVTLLLLIHTLKQFGAKSVTAVVPYLAYSRQDKVEVNKSLGVALVGSLLKAAGVDRLVTFDIHSEAAQNLIEVPTTFLSAQSLFVTELQLLKDHEITLVAPDEGAIPRTEKLRITARVKAPIAHLTKRRVDGIKLFELVGQVQTTAVIIDDILDTGSTLVACCKQLQKVGVKTIYIMVTHGQFTGVVWQELWNLGVESIYCTDSLPLVSLVKTPKIKVLELAPILARVLI